MPTTTSATEARHALMLATEELYSTEGPGVSLRTIAQAAGQRNNSAVNYHFGSREGLEEAIVATRTGAMEQRRLEQLASLTGEEPSLGQLTHVLVEPMLTTPAEQGATHYARFVEVVRARPAMLEHHDEAPTDGDPLWRASHQVTRLIARHLTHLDKAARVRRVTAMSTTLFALAADRERALTEGEDAQTPEEITTLLVGLLQA